MSTASSLGMNWIQGVEFSIERMSAELAKADLRVGQIYSITV
jgi:hypothetical protein